jgi:hypothetical protein
MTVCGVPFLRLRSGHSQKTVRPEALEGWTAPFDMLRVNGLVVHVIHAHSLKAKVTVTKPLPTGRQAYRLALKGEGKDLKTVK